MQKIVWFCIQRGLLAVGSSIYMRVVYKELVKSAKNWEKLVKSEMHLSS